MHVGPLDDISPVKSWGVASAILRLRRPFNKHSPWRVSPNIQSPFSAQTSLSVAIDRLFDYGPVPRIRFIIHRHLPSRERPTCCRTRKMTFIFEFDAPLFAAVDGNPGKSPVEKIPHHENPCRFFIYFRALRSIRFSPNSASL